MKMSLIITVDNLMKRGCRWLSKSLIVIAFIVLMLILINIKSNDDNIDNISVIETDNTNNNEIQCDGIMYPSKPIKTLTELLICNKTSNTMKLSHEDFIFNCTYLDETRVNNIANITFGYDREVRLDTITTIINNDNFHTYIDNTIMVTVVNKGLVYLFLNWICSIEKNLGKKELASIKKSIIVIAADTKCYQILIEHNFNTIKMESIIPGLKVSEKHPRGFGDNKIMFLKLAVYILVYDLLVLNYNVFWCDVDVVWLKNPINYFINRESDLFLTSDGRYITTHAVDIEGPYNAGVAYIRSNCRTILAFESILHNAGIVKMFYTPVTDQGLLNMIVTHSPLFKNLKIVLLPWQLFINGNIFHDTVEGQDMTKLKMKEIIMIHASWTDGYEDKIKKFNSFDAFYYNRSMKCTYFNSSHVFFDYM